MQHSLSRHRSAHVAETLEDAAEAAGDPVELLVEKAVADERREELLARTLTIAEDTALREQASRPRPRPSRRDRRGLREDR